MIPFNLNFFRYGGIPIPLVIGEGFRQRFIRDQACFRTLLMDISNKSELVKLILESGDDMIETIRFKR
jgi:hypothetical protein